MAVDGFTIHSPFILHSMPGDTCDCTCACPHVYMSTRLQYPARAKNHPCQHHCQPCNHTCEVGTSFVAAATLVTVTFCFHNSGLSCFILYKASEMLQQQETLYFVCTDLGSHVQFEIITSNLSCELALLH